MLKLKEPYGLALESIGKLNDDTREVFRAAIREAATAIICAHNHPSGDPAPSTPDLHVTRLLREAARAVDVDFIDHIILGRSAADPAGRGYFSFKEAGIL